MSSEAGLNLMNDIVYARADVHNRLLTKMSPEDWSLLAPHLEMVTLKERQVVEVPGKTDWYLVRLNITPHLKYLGSPFSLAVSGKLEKS